MGVVCFLELITNERRTNERMEQAANRGGGGGKLSKQLQAQSADGGRKEEALRIADSKQRGEPIVVSSSVLSLISGREGKVSNTELLFRFDTV